MATYAIYTQKDCVPCKQAKEKFQQYGVHYTEYVIGEDITRDEVKQKFPEAKITPVIYNYRTNSIIQLPVLDLVLMAEQMMEKAKNE